MITLASTIKTLNSMNKGTLMEQLGMEYLTVEDGYVKAKMPVDKRTIQPFKILHGGASLAFAETLASLGSAVLVDLDRYDVRGASLNGNHVGSVARGFVYGEATILHRGSMTHVWDVEIKDQGGYRVSVARVTIMVIQKQDSPEASPEKRKSV